jgi:uncharacterized protein YlzI (FlbEa/FlbD family)
MSRFEIRSVNLTKGNFIEIEDTEFFTHESGPALVCKAAIESESDSEIPNLTITFCNARSIIIKEEDIHDIMQELRMYFVENR